MQIQIGKLRLAFLFDLSLRDVNIANAQGVKLIDVNELGIDLNFSSLLRGEIKVDGFDIYDADVDTQDLITGVIIKGPFGTFPFAFAWREVAAGNGYRECSCFG